MYIIYYIISRCFSTTLLGVLYCVFVCVDYALMNDLRQLQQLTWAAHRLVEVLVEACVLQVVHRGVELRGNVL
jgi:hypothetical protein